MDGNPKSLYFVVGAVMEQPKLLLTAFRQGQTPPRYLDAIPEDPISWKVITTHEESLLC